MDHGGQFEREGKAMSQVQMAGVGLCDNLPSPKTLTVQSQNLNETSTLTQSENLSLLQKEDGGERGLIQKVSFSNNGKNREEEEESEGYTRGESGEDKEEDIDEVMKEEEEELSEGSSSLIRCQSPDTPMTDSSYSETGSLLETPYPLSPGTSPEPTSPVMPVVSPETPFPISHAALSQRDVEVEFSTSSNVSGSSNTGVMAAVQTFTTGSVDTLTMTSYCRSPSPPGPICITEVTEHCTSSSESVINYGLKCTREFSNSSTEHITSTAEMFTIHPYNTTLNTSVACTRKSATTGPLTVTTGSMKTGTESTSSTEPTTSNWEQNTSIPAPRCFSLSNCASQHLRSPELLDLEQLAKRGDDTHLPQYLHQIAEAFVLNGDYQRALWCIQLERIYHQRVLDNLNALQEQWESQCRRTSPELAAQHLDTLKHICQTHSRPRAKDAGCSPPDILRPTIKEGGELAQCTSANQVDGGMEQRAEDSSHFQSGHPVIPSCNLADGLNSPDISGKDREDPDRELGEREGFHGSQLTDRERGEAEGWVGYSVSIIRNELHPSATGGMEQSKPAEQQGGDLGLTQERKTKREVGERDKEEAAKTLEMEEEGEDEEEEKPKEENTFSQKTHPVENLASGANVEEQQLHQVALAEEKLHEETQESSKSPLHQEAYHPQEAHMKQQEQVEQEEEVEEEYEVEQADIIEAVSLDDMAKLITVEEMSPAFGLVSILKKRSVCVDNESMSASAAHQPDKTPAKRRVRFRVPDDGYEHDVGGGDSCLLLFLLCLVTVVISLGGTALYCALGDARSAVCQDFSRNADFYLGQIQHGISQIQHWFTPGS